MKVDKFRTVFLVFGWMFVFTNAFAQNRQEQPRKRPSFEQLLKDLDSNGDGKLSKKEIKGPLKDNFDKIDTNKDGFLTEDELKKAPRPERKERN